jgi:hypothetical protein
MFFENGSSESAFLRTAEGAEGAEKEQREIY